MKLLQTACALSLLFAAFYIGAEAATTSNPDVTTGDDSTQAPGGASPAASTSGGATAAGGSTVKSATPEAVTSGDLTTAEAPNTCYSCDSVNSSNCATPVSGTTPTCTGNICFSIIDGDTGTIKRDCLYSTVSTCSSDNTGAWAGSECYYCCTSNLCNTMALTKDACNKMRNSASLLNVLPVSLLLLLSLALQRLWS